MTRTGRNVRGWTSRRTRACRKPTTWPVACRTTSATASRTRRPRRAPSPAWAAEAARACRRNCAAPIALTASRASALIRRREHDRAAALGVAMRHASSTIGPKQSGGAQARAHHFDADHRSFADRDSGATRTPRRRLSRPCPTCGHALGFELVVEALIREEPWLARYPLVKAGREAECGTWTRIYSSHTDDLGYPFAAIGVRERPHDPASSARTPAVGDRSRRRHAPPRAQAPGRRR